MANDPQKDKTENSSQPPVARERAKPATAELGVRLSDKAAEQIKTIIAKNEYPDTMYLYVGVKGGGCSGLEYVLDLRDEAHAPLRDDDEVFDSHGVLIVCDLKSYIVGNLNGTEVNYQDDSLMGAGFSFNNPNAQKTCGCGASYTT
ncbi:MAG: iron-sulfur cluster assembly accessory protein [Planctomycetota bacterium]